MSEASTYNALRGKREVKNARNPFQIFSKQRANEILVAGVASWEEHLRMLIVLEREYLELRKEIEHLSGPI